MSINKNLPIINVAAVIFQFNKSMCLKAMSIKAFRGIPRIVPMEINSGKVKAIPKLMKKLKANEHSAETQWNPRDVLYVKLLHFSEV